MEANLFLLLAAGVLVAAGVYLLLDRAMTKMLLGLLLLGNGANLFLLQSGGSAGSPPIDGRDSEPFGTEIADPLAQAMILTAIVISIPWPTASTATARMMSLKMTRKIPLLPPRPRAPAMRPPARTKMRPMIRLPAAPPSKAITSALHPSRNQ